MKAIKTIIIEEVLDIVKESVGELLGISQLADYLSRMKPEITEDVWQDLLQEIYRDEGDSGVKNFFYGATKGTDLQILGKGKYALKF